MGRSAPFYVCQSCGAQSRQFFGRCPGCGSWNSLVEQSNPAADGRRRRTTPAPPADGAAPRARRSEPIHTVGERPLRRLATGFPELDRVLGGGLVPGSLVLVGGDPGIGKSTLLLQSAQSLADVCSVLYVSAEESAQQVKLRWRRLGPEQAAEGEGASDQAGLQLLAETDLELVLQELEALRPAVAIIDSIQALHDAELSSAPGSVSQVRDCAAALQRLAKRQDTALLLVGHVTKEGMLAGPKVLEHLVDAVLTFEGDRFASHRLLRAVKNRFGATHELGVFEMRDRGLVEVTNPSELFLGGEGPCAGTATIVACEGTRPLLVDLQALVSTTSYASPRRTATGIGINRLHQILAVLEKHLGLPLSRFDCYLAVAGGLDVEEPAADLGVAAAVVASYRDLTLPAGTVLVGELGLGGQIRSVGQLELRLQEAARLGFTRAVVPRGSGLAPAAAALGLELLEAGGVAEALVTALGVDPAAD
ncbi:DNA repair protein RadA [Synechococcus sp. Cruz-9H2]|uniref:DNA repair protein RadA n=1 Tax=unclassified Synechococcus TaxID=2626047 RepID=UPI0020CEC00B|nr:MULTISPECIES: DNA repair protein RadA [unclassified Synechococcus]MCP9820523.1 DNA repair protein RadA [Synechococcus sp. Cruz-9H2]MCP9843316.1 DNA repair protein RadA [Synechococcus sp. Edmonson 11F2]MCP9855061.1 DNA repair protein RadA [Synechococcus sp. Cruz-9C9]MCP9862468.1 DNA repair protein RadA [Synechococcus sp. Cruz-7E5]MCP9871377.1 DNA repair protein RadA [Synechococcus sp. Cruz-7B9]